MARGRRVASSKFPSLWAEPAGMISISTTHIFILFSVSHCCGYKIVDAVFSFLVAFLVDLLTLYGFKTNTNHLASCCKGCHCNCCTHDIFEQKCCCKSWRCIVDTFTLNKVCNGADMLELLNEWLVSAAILVFLINFVQHLNLRWFSS